MKNIVIKQLYETLISLTQNTEIKLPVKLSYTLLKNKNLLEPLYQAMEQSRQEYLMNQNLELNNGSFVVPNEKVPEINKGLQELLELDNEEIKLTHIKLEELSNYELPFDVVNGLMSIIDEE